MFKCPIFSRGPFRLHRNLALFGVDGIRCSFVGSSASLYIGNSVPGTLSLVLVLGDRILYLQAFVCNRTTIQLSDSSCGRIPIVIRDKAKASATPSFIFHHDANRYKIPIGRKQSEHVQICHFAGDMKNKQVASCGTAKFRERHELHIYYEVLKRQIMKSTYPECAEVVWIGGPGEPAGNRDLVEPLLREE